MKTIFLSLILLSVSAWGNDITPQQLVLTNQFGEQSQNWVQGTYLPLPGTSYNMVIASGTITPNAATLAGYAGTGSLYINRNLALYGSAKLFINFGTITTPAWQKVGP